MVACQPPAPQQDARIQAQVQTAEAANRPTFEFGYNSKPACDGVRLMLQSSDEREFRLKQSVMPHYQKANPDVRAALSAVQDELEASGSGDSVETAVQNLVVACQLAGYSPLTTLDPPISAAPRNP